MTHVYRGAATSGLEFSGSFQANSQATYNYLAGKGLDLVRIPFLWDEIQPVINGDLDTTGLAYLDENIAWAETAGLKIILDMHNFGRRYVYANGGFTDDFDQGTQHVFNYPYGDHNSGAGTITLRDYGRATAGTAANPVSPADSYKLTLTFKVNSITNNFDELIIETYRTDDNNKYALYINPALDTWYLRKHVAGITTTLASGLKTFNTATDYVVIVDVNQAQAGKINVKIDGSDLFTANSVNSDAALTGGYIGIMPNALNVTIKDVTLNVDGDTSSGGPTERIVTQSQLPIAAWNDFWDKLSDRYKGNPNIIAYDHNEPHDMPIPTTTTNYSQAVADAHSVPVCTNTYMIQQMLNTIRANGDTKYIVAEYDSFANLHRHTELYTADPDPWIVDSLSPAKVIYSGHYYLDVDHSGSYSNPATRSIASIDAEVTPAFAWAFARGVPFLLGEVGVDNTSPWQAGFEEVYRLADTYNIWVTQWSAGDIYSSATTLQPTSNYTVDRLQMAVVEAHPPYDTVTPPDVGWATETINPTYWTETTI